jgi:hypothetical protein
MAIVTRDVEAAKLLDMPNVPWISEGIGYFIQSILKGAFIFAEAT